MAAVVDTVCSVEGRASTEERLLRPRPAAVPSGKGSNGAAAPPLPGEEEVLSLQYQETAGEHSQAGRWQIGWPASDTACM